MAVPSAIVGLNSPGTGVSTPALKLASTGERPLVLGVEAIFARDQHIVDEWLRGEIDGSCCAKMLDR